MKAKLAVRTGLLMILIFLGISCEKEPSSPGIGPLYVIEVIPYALNVEIDSSYQFSAVGRDADMNKIENLTFTWTSKHPEVGTVDQNGLFTAISSGTTFLTAKSGTVESANATVSVYDPVFSIEIEPDSLTVYVDSTAQFTAAGKDLNGNDILGLSYIWESGNTNIATINNEGVVTGITPGNTTVIVKLRDVESLPANLLVEATIPQVSTSDVSNISKNSAQSGGIITSDGGATITSRGVCWSTNPAPTIDDEKTTDGSGTGSYTSDLAGLMHSTDYYVRAYATNRAGTGYGNAIYFTTDAFDYGSLMDIDGNEYLTIQLGEQEWMAENLRVTHYNNGDTIPNVTNGTEWSNLTLGAYCEYDNSTAKVDTFSRLYNWYAINDSRNIAPNGWHVPSDDEWKQLEIYLGMSQSEADDSVWRGTDQGSQLAGNAELWNDGVLENNGVFGSSGFAALPGGYRSNNGNFESIGDAAFFWSATPGDISAAWDRGLYFTNAAIHRYNNGKQAGFSVRLVRD